MIPQPVKDLIRLIIVTLLPIAFIAIKTAFPDFPLSQDSFVALIVWAVGLLLGGWQANYLWHKYVV